jgi:hypothetical protein
MPYHQRFTGTFVPDLSIVDMLFNLGPDSARLIRGAEDAVLRAERGIAVNHDQPLRQGLGPL